MANLTQQPPGDLDIVLAPLEPGTTLDLRMTAEAAADAASTAPIEAAISLFATAVNASMFSHGRIASLEIDPLPAPHTSAIAQRWRVTGADTAALHVLAGLLDTVHRELTPLRHVRLLPGTPSASTPLLDRSEVFALPYPSYPKPPPFSLWLKHRLAGAKDYLIRVAFERPVSDAEFDRLEASFVTWNRLVTHGAFGNARGEVLLDDSIVRSQTYMAAPDTLEHEFVVGIGHVGAFEALINMVIALGRTLAPVKRLEIT
jgi:hypothetical protein